jgi:hypothetical protein
MRFHDGENVDCGLLSYDDMYLGGYKRYEEPTPETFISINKNYTVS